MSEQTGYRTFRVDAGSREFGGIPRGILTTEQPVEMFDWSRGDYVPEVLLMSGMKLRGESIKLLDTHNTDSVKNVLGTFTNIQIHEAGKRNVPYNFADGQIEISKAEPEVETKLVEGHINEMSVGYRYSDEKTEYLEEDETKTINGQKFTGPLNIRTEWHAQEASLVPLGADDQAQIRGFNNFAEARKKISRNDESEPSNKDSLTTDQVTAHDPVEAEVSPEIAEKTQTKQNNIKPLNNVENNENNNGEKLQAEAIQKGVKAGQDAFDKRADAILALGEEVGDANWGLSQLRSGKSVEEVQRAAIAKLKEANANVGYKQEEEVGLSKKEKKRYSLSGALLALAEGRKPEGLEGEVSDFISERCDRRPDGFFVAPEALRGDSQRNLVAGTASDGDELVENELRSGEFIDVLRPNMVSAQAGIRILNGLVGDVVIPRKTQAAEASFKTEVATFTESEPQFDTITLSPNHLGCFTDVSKQLLHQGLPDVDALIRDDLNQAIAVGLDKAVFQGSGSGEPQGIDGATGVTTSTISSAAAPDKAEIFDFLANVDTGNALGGALSWVTTPALASYLKQTQIDSSTGKYYWDMASDTVLGYRAYSTSQAAQNDIFFGNFNDYILGVFDGIDIVADIFTGAKTRTVTYVVNVMADGDVRRGASFCTNA